MNAALGRKSTLDGLLVLVVEDESMVAMLLEDMLDDLGCQVVGPAARVAEALALIGEQRIDAAVLDINLAGEKVFPVADELAARGIPFVFASGYGAVGVDGHHRNRTVLQKPYRLVTLQRALEAIVRG